MLRLPLVDQVEIGIEGFDAVSGTEPLPDHLFGKIAGEGGMVVFRHEVSRLVGWGPHRWVRW